LILAPSLQHEGEKTVLIAIALPPDATMLEFLRVVSVYGFPLMVAVLAFGYALEWYLESDAPSAAELEYRYGNDETENE
jgi:hypothetical protein